MYLILSAKKNLKLILYLALSPYNYLFIPKYPLNNKFKYKPTRHSWWHKKNMFENVPQCLAMRWNRPLYKAKLQYKNNWYNHKLNNKNEKIINKHTRG